MSQYALSAVERPDVTAPKPAAGRQPQIQALRAVAVLSVILYHFWPSRLSGGYAGVDVFFVISGYLMTKSILHIRHDRDGHLRSTMREFYSRRIARILPAALLTLLVCAVVVLTALPSVSWSDDLKQILASSLFFENWFLASHATDYLGSSATSPVQHFWSLSVEEQFYAVWPLFVFFAAKAGPRLTARGRTVRLLTCFGLVTVVSLAYSVYETGANSSVAYFHTGTRFWELSFGAVAFIIDRDLQLGARLRAAAGWAGLVLIGYTLVTFTGTTVFPGWHAGIPVLGAALVILSSPRSAPWGPGRFLTLRFPQWIGDISYSMYLIHWPLLILVTESANGGAPLSTPVKLAFLPLIVLASALMKRLVEDRFRRTKAREPRGRRAAPTARRSRGRPVRRTILVVAVIEIAVVAVSVGGLRRHDQLVAKAGATQAGFSQSAAAQAACYAAISAGKTSPSCPQMTSSVLSLVPSPLVAVDDWPYRNCQEGLGATGLSCTLNQGSAGLLVVAGDSHITQWLPAILPWAQSHHLTVKTFLHSGCPLSADQNYGAACTAWNNTVLGDITALKPKYLFTSAQSALTSAERDTKIASLVTRWRQLTSGGTKMVAFRDIPQPDHGAVSNVPDCLVRSGSLTKCQFDEQRGLSADLVEPAAAQVPGTSLIDLADKFCPQSVCKPEVNGILVWIDGGHMSSYFAHGLTAALAPQLDAAISS